MFTRPACHALVFLSLGVCLLWVSLPGQAAPTQEGSTPKQTRSDSPKAPGEILHVEGTITEKDQLVGQKLAQVHKVALQAGKAYLIDMISQEKNPKEFDPFLILKDSEGKIVASDDDGGGFPNARILYKPTVGGTYQVIATTFAGNMVGKYLLIVREAPPGLAAVEEIKQDLLKSLQTLQKDFYQAKDQKDRAQVVGRLFQALKEQGERLLAVARKHGKEEPDTDAAVEQFLRQIGQLMQQLSPVLSSIPAPAATKAVRDLRNQIPYPLVKGEYTLILSGLLRQDYERAYQEKDSRAAQAFYEEAHELLQKLARDKSPLPEHLQESWKLLTRQAEDTLFLLEHLSVGKMAPELEGEDLAGNKLKLSAYRGKVVVLDFWGFWCPHCVKMLPDERQLVQRLSKRPFVLLGINTDRDREVTRKRMEKEEITWPNFWDDGGKLSQQYRVSYFPTIYVLDARGVIRYRDVRGTELEQAVEALLREVERPPAER